VESRAVTQETGGGNVSQVAGALVIYDLPSGYIGAIKDKRIRNLFIRARRKCSYLLRRNGINVTEGVLLVPKERVPETEGGHQGHQDDLLRTLEEGRGGGDYGSELR
jgi:hypothetical protein